MKDGYYWARLKTPLGMKWEPVEVWAFDSGRQEVSELGNEYSFKLDEFEFGDKIEIPEKYK